MRIDFSSIPGVLPEITLKLTHSKKKARRIIRKMCGSSDEWDALRDCDATTSPLQNAETGETVYLVWMTPYLEYGASTDAALLAHEAVHVAADYLQSLGMEDVDEEVMAYTVQAVSEYLIEEHFKWKKRHLDKDWLTAKRTDGWQSGRLRLFAKQVSAQSVSGVQIPHHPPYRESSHLWVAFFMPRFGSSER